MNMIHCIGSILPEPIKKTIIWLINRPSRIHAWLYTAASKGKLPCPDRLFLHWMYWVFTGQRLNLKHPVTFQDKLNWLKLYNRNPLYTKLVDKYAVREWVAEKIGPEYLVPLYGVYDKFDDIDFDQLPDKFVLKCTHDSGSVCIVKDKKSMNLSEIKEKIERGLATKQFYLSREWPYKNVKPRIICEKFLEDVIINDVPDYKFFCFAGEPKILTYNFGRFSKDGLKIDIYDVNWKLLDVSIKGYHSSGIISDKPKDFDKMIELSKILSNSIPFVRVDFMYSNKHIYFTEMTFYPSGARKPFIPYKFNVELGKLVILPDKK